MGKEKIIHIENLNKSFNGTSVIRDLSMSLYAGENLVILGKSGSGKSVIVKCIVKLMEADSGKISVFGTEVTACSSNELSDVRSKVGYLFQEGALYDSMSVRENLLFPALRNYKTRKLGMPQLDELVRQNLDSVGLLEAIDKMPSELSGGMKKRAGLARTLMLSPDLIIYDEPTTGLDPYTSESIIHLILKVQSEYNTTSIIITHDIKCAELTGDRICVLHDGNFIAEGVFDTVKKKDDPEVRLFFK
ncbi:MAG: ATP-binding cassette domain-containing protein [Bacteroidales bacterium]|nr:ATP-binding cassette domain-containing protein [Bacteroidales bacterium]